LMHARDLNISNCHEIRRFADIPFHHNNLKKNLCAQYVYI